MFRSFDKVSQIGATLTTIRMHSIRCSVERSATRKLPGGNGSRQERIGFNVCLACARIGECKA
ncbi:hypothetical protein KOR42_21430 [Thalassoglobus neptunius]|uniref:Uncharacterized protein n=1 Tax=Thalassoglobus neptunius TaxID=1938619 RepID=A0A5C5X6L5_9PLAN|nr:hypothetical protein KOR42_21430 [Thalassoglobus neptunius]